MLEQLEDTCSVLAQAGRGLGDMWAHRRKVFFLSFFSVFLFYCVFIVLPFFMQGGENVDFMSLFSMVSVGLYSYVVTPLFSLHFGQQEIINGLSALFSFYIISVLSVVIFRFLLKKEQSSSLFVGYLDSFQPLAVLLWYGVWLSALLFAYTVLIIVVAFGGHQTFWGICILVASLVPYYLGFRFIFVPVYLANGNCFSSLKESWCLTRGHLLSLLLVPLSLFIIVKLSLLLQGVSEYFFNFMNHFLPDCLIYFMQSAVDVFLLFFMWIWMLSFISRVWGNWHKKQSV